MIILTLKKAGNFIWELPLGLWYYDFSIAPLTSGLVDCYHIKRVVDVNIHILHYVDVV